MASAYLIATFADSTAPTSASGSANVAMRYALAMAHRHLAHRRPRGAQAVAFHFPDGDHRQQPDEQEEAAEEEAEAADEGADLDERRPVHHPRRRQIAAVQRGDDDHEALEPHADVDEDGEDEQRGDARADPLRPQRLRRERVARDHRPEAPRVR